MDKMFRTEGFESQTEALSARLLDVTSWSNYGGSIHNRLAYMYLLDVASNVVSTEYGIMGSYGLKLATVRADGASGRSIRTVIEAIVEMEQNGYLEDVWEYEHEAQIEELQTWHVPEFIGYVEQELEKVSGDWHLNAFLVGQNNDLGLFFKFVMEDFDADAYFEWESATSLVVRGVEYEEAGKNAAMFLLTEYAKNFNPTQETELDID